MLAQNRAQKPSAKRAAQLEAMLRQLNKDGIMDSDDSGASSSFTKSMNTTRNSIHNGSINNNNRATNNSMLFTSTPMSERNGKASFARPRVSAIPNYDYEDDHEDTENHRSSKYDSKRSKWNRFFIKVISDAHIKYKNILAENYFWI